MPTSRTKELTRVRIHHFHSYNKVRLTIYTIPFINPLNKNEVLYAVGMALCHKKDNGSRTRGRALARIYALQAENEANEPNPTTNYRTDKNSRWLLIQPGTAIFRSAETLKNLVVWLRKIEWDEFITDSKLTSIYNRVFRGQFIPKY